MKFLIVEDDQISGVLLKAVLAPYGACDMVMNGLDAVAAVKKSLLDKTPYALICLDIMLPGIDGRDVLRQIRKLEETNGIEGLDGVNIVMITALSDNRTIIEAFRSQCEGYIVKPIRKEKVLSQLVSLGIIKQ